MCSRGTLQGACLSGVSRFCAKKGRGMFLGYRLTGCVETSLFPDLDRMKKGTIYDLACLRIAIRWQQGHDAVRGH